MMISMMMMIDGIDDGINDAAAADDDTFELIGDVQLGWIEHQQYQVCSFGEPTADTSEIITSS
jgi:hypothetical protein